MHSILSRIQAVYSLSFLLWSCNYMIVYSFNLIIVPEYSIHILYYMNKVLQSYNIIYIIIMP